MSGVELVELHSRRWVRLPGTRFEVLLFGKTGELLVRRDGGPVDGWTVPLDAVYIRRADLGEGT